MTAVRTALTRLAAKEPDLKRPEVSRSRWSASFATAAFRMVLGRGIDEGGLAHHAQLLEQSPQARHTVLHALEGSEAAHKLRPVPEIKLDRHTPRDVIARLHRLEEAGKRRDVYVAEVLAAVEGLRASLVEQLDAALHRSALARGQRAADLAVEHLSSARSFTAGGDGSVTVVDVAGMLVAVPGEDWPLGARLSLRGDPERGLTEHAATVLAVERDDRPAVLLDLGAGGDGGLAALRAARTGSVVHLVEPDARRRDLLAGAFALNDLSPAGLHAAAADVTQTVDAVRLHGVQSPERLGAALADLPPLADDVRVFCSAASRPAQGGWVARGVEGVPGAWTLMRA